MFRHLIYRPDKSFIPNVVAGLVIFIAMLFCLLICFMMYSFGLVKNNTIDTSENEMTIYANSMEHNLNTVDKDLETLMSDPSNLYALSNDNEAVRYYSAIKLQGMLNERMLVNQSASALLILDETHDTHLTVYDTRMELQDKNFIQNYLKETIHTNCYPKNGMWQCVTFGKKAFFIEIYHFESAVLAGVIDCDSFLAMFNEMERDENSQVILSSPQGEELGNGHGNQWIKLNGPIHNKPKIKYINSKYLMVNLYFEKGNVYLSKIIKTSKIGFHFYFYIPVRCLVNGIYSLFYNLS